MSRLQRILPGASWPLLGSVGVLFLLSLLMGKALAAGVSFPTRVLYQEQGQYGVNVSISNQSNTDYLLQSRVVTGPQSDKPGPFMVLPPLKKLAAHQDTVLVIRRTGGELPTNKESLFWLSVRMIPGESGDKQPEGMKLRLVTDYRIKVFYRPKALSNGQGVADALKALTARRQGNHVVLINPTPYYLSLAQLTQGENNATQITAPIPPLGQAEYPFDGPLTAAPLSITVFNEYGVVLPARQIAWVN